MNLAQLYSNTIGQKIDRIYTNEKYYPLPFKDYIVIQPYSKPAKNWDYFSDTISLLFPILEKNGIKIVQVGGPNEPPIQYCHHTQGTTNWGQLQYLIKNAKLVLCVDSISAHLAGHYNVPLIDLISNNFKECVAPYFGDKSKQVILEPDRSKLNPSFSLDEGLNKQVNQIKIEKVTQFVLDLLGINEKININTIYVGPFYKQTVVELVPNQVVTPNFLQGFFTIRYDYGGDENNVYQQLSVSKCQIFTDKPLNLDILAQLKANLVGIVLILKDNNLLKFAIELKRRGFPFGAASSLDNETLNKLKLQFMDYTTINQLPDKKLDSIPNSNIVTKDTYFKSAKTVLSNNKIYASYQHVQKDLPCAALDNNESKVIIDDPKFWGEIEAMWIFNRE